MEKVMRIIVFSFIFCILNIGVFASENNLEKHSQKENDIIMKFELEKTTGIFTQKIQGEVFDKQNKIIVTYSTIGKTKPKDITTWKEVFYIKEFDFNYIITESNENREYYYIDFRNGVNVKFLDSEGDLYYRQNYVNVLL